jgi:4-hydroxy-tetrahydrodipicolinate reductase
MSLNLTLLGAGKTGSLVAEVARKRGHSLQVFDEVTNRRGSALTKENLQGTDVVIDFTTPDAVIENIELCARLNKNIVVGTTGWYQHIPEIRNLVDQTEIGFLYASNFSIGMNLFFEVARTAGIALKQGYQGQIMERHHVHKKDSPSGTAVVLQRILAEQSGEKVEIVSVREGETVGMHVVLFDSEYDSMMLTHDAKSRLGFASGAVRAAEWLHGRRGFFEFKDIFKELT